MIKSRFFWLTLVLVVSTIAMKMIDSRLVSEHTPAGIISFQLAGSFHVINQIVTNWSHFQLKLALFQLGFDFLFLFIYCSFLYAVSTRLQKARGIKSQSYIEKSPYLCWLVLTADCIENIFAAKLLLSAEIKTPITQLPMQIFEHLDQICQSMFYAASVKFVALTWVFVYIIYALWQYRLSFKST